MGAGASAAVLVNSERGQCASGTEPVEPTALAELATELAREAGGLLLERYRAGVATGVQSKTTPTDLVSAADLDAESLLRDRIAQARPHDGILGEEGADVPGDSGLRWVIDPLDGTVNFLFGIPQWSVSVAVQEIGVRTLAGVVFDPCRDELWTAVAGGHGSLDGTPIHGSRRDELATAMVATGFAYDAAVREGQARVLAPLIPRVRDIRRLGSAALDLAWTAAGRYDAYFERSVKQWDVAAGLLICEAAGVSFRELSERDGLPAGVLVAAPGIVEELHELVR